MKTQNKLQLAGDGTVGSRSPPPAWPKGRKGLCQGGRRKNNPSQIPARKAHEKHNHAQCVSLLDIVGSQHWQVFVYLNGKGTQRALQERTVYVQLHYNHLRSLSCMKPVTDGHMYGECPDLPHGPKEVPRNKSHDYSNTHGKFFLLFLRVFTPHPHSNFLIFTFVHLTYFCPAFWHLHTMGH